MQASMALQDIALDEIQEAQNGFEAVQLVKSQPMTQMFDFIVMDLDMPIMNGWQACTQMRTFFNDENCLFRVSTSNAPSADIKNSASNHSKSGISDHENDNQPFIFAYSAYVDNTIEQKAT